MTGPNNKRNPRAQSRRPQGQGWQGNRNNSGNTGGQQQRPANYTELFHHNLGGLQNRTQQQNNYGNQNQNQSQNPYGNQQQRPYPGQQQRPPQKPRHSAPARPPAKKGYTSYTFEIKDELFKDFTQKLRTDDKTPKEVINQLISFFNMGKIKI